jgi:predicted  nucleic acid-binding Zn-ribbon protein
MVSHACLVCGAVFERLAASRITVCGPGCKKERTRLANAEYRNLGRKLRERLLSEFGETPPTADDFVAILQQRKALK